MKILKILNVASWLCVILWMVLIFNLSSQVAEKSNQLSTGITEVVIETVERIAPQADLDIKQINHIVRKNAHFFTYLVLGILVFYALRRSGLTGIRTMIFALGICIIYAIADEIHQLFVPGRGGQIKDVLIDSAGGTIGNLIYLFADKMIKRMISKRNRTKIDLI